MSGRDVIGELRAITEGWRSEGRDEGDLRRREALVANALEVVDFSEQEKTEALQTLQEFVGLADDTRVVERVKRIMHSLEAES